MHVAYVVFLLESTGLEQYENKRLSSSIFLPSSHTSLPHCWAVPALSAVIFLSSLWPEGMYFWIWTQKQVTAKLKLGYNINYFTT